MKIQLKREGKKKDFQAENIKPISICDICF